jgi:hypothetical protein
MSTAVPLLEPTVIPDVDRPTEVVEEGDHDKFAHVVVPASAVTEAYITGRPVTALCGKTWVPTRDPKKFPPCQECQDVLAEIVLGSRGYGPH